MAYDISDVELYQWGQDSTFGATSVLHYIVGPKGKVGFVRDMLVDVTTSLVGTTAVPEVQVGISSGDFTYGRYRLGTTASNGYGVGPHRAGGEYITGNPPRLASDFASHVVLDGGPLTSAGIAGGSYGTVVPKGRIPASGWTVTNVINGTANVCRVFLNGTLPAKDLLTGQLVTVQGVAGATGVNNNITAISAIDTTNYQWIELSGTTFGGTYTSGGFVFLAVVVTLLAGNGSGAGGGHVKVKIQWLGAEEV